MKGFDDEGVIKHRSADDLDDGYYLLFISIDVMTFNNNNINKFLIFSFDFGDDDVKPLAYDSEGKPLNCGELVTVNEETNGNVNNYLLYSFKF